MTTTLTAEEFAVLPSVGMLLELVRGIPRTRQFPFPRKGEICGQIGCLLKTFLADHRIGRATCNSGIVTRRDPDSVRGADIAYYSFARLPADVPLPMRGYANVVPELVFEVRSYTDRWSEIHTKVAEYLAAGVDTVVVLDEQTQQAWMFRADDQPREFAHEDAIEFPKPLDGWQVIVRQFFE